MNGVYLVQRGDIVGRRGGFQAQLNERIIYIPRLVTV